MRVLLFSLFIFIGTNTAFAQTKTSANEKDFARKPLWIGMLEDTAANYFVVENAFNTYFKHHEMPAGENEDMGEKRFRNKNLSKKMRKKIQAENAMRMDVKRYNLWHEQMLPYVQSDGRILTPTQRLEIWKQQQRRN